MFSKKEKVNLRDLSVLGFKYLLKPQDLDLSVVNPDKILSENEEIAIKERLLYFKSVAFSDMAFQYCIQKRLSYSEEEIFQHLGYGLSGALLSELNYTEDKLEEFLGKFLDYNQGSYEYFSQLINKSERTDITFGFSMCKEFADFFEKDILTEYNRTRNFVVFDLAKQIYSMVENLFLSLLKQFMLF